tara:strand:- start:1407 stop:1982 length:576 start_codon:yes stop_codon:yes gene_type:complete
MSAVLSKVDLEKEIMDEIRSWSEECLEQNSVEYNNLPVCPFAKKAWREKKVGFSFNYNDSYTLLYDEIESFDGSLDLVILVDLSYEEDADFFHNNLEILNERISTESFKNKDIFLMGFHPDDETNELIDDEDFEANIEEAYSMVFIQSLTKLYDASQKLTRMGYYDRYTGNYNVNEIFKKRTELYGRLKNG